MFHPTYKIKYRRLWIISLLLISCAQITAPTGGKKDTQPPALVKATPQNYSTNFHQKEIKMVFSEWIQPFQNAKNQVIISPAIEPFPKITAERNELVIKLKDSLQRNTTYSIFFGDNIKDNNEGNPYSNFKYIFSTGNFIDSLELKGIVKTNLDKIPDNTYVLLYKEKEDSAFIKKKPYYISKVTSDGNFHLENIKEGDYRAYVLSDKNGNYYYDLPTESIGFSDSVFHVKSSMAALSFLLFTPEEEKLRIHDFDRIINGGILHLTFNKQLSFTKDQVTVSVFENSEITPIAFQEESTATTAISESKMSVYFPKMNRDTSNLTLVIKNKDVLIDTLRVRMESKNFKKPVFFFNDTASYKSLNVVETKPLKLTASYYSLSPIDTAKINLTDTANKKIPFTVSRGEDLHTYFFNGDWKPSVKYKLGIADSAFYDLVGNYNRKQEFSLEVQPAKKTGNLLITYTLPDTKTPFVTFLKDNSGKVLDKRILRDSLTVKIDYGLLLPGTYSVEVFEDTNGNGIWNSGNFATKTLPERIYKETKPIVVKENWEAEEKIKIDFSQTSKLPSEISPSTNPLKPEERKPGGK